MWTPGIRPAWDCDPAQPIGLAELPSPAVLLSQRSACAAAARDHGAVSAEVGAVQGAGSCGGPGLLRTGSSHAAHLKDFLLLRAWHYSHLQGFKHHP